MKVRYLKHRPRRRTVWLNGPVIVIPPEAVAAIRQWLQSFTK